MYISSILSSLLTTVFFIFIIAALGYLLGGITVKGISLGTAGVLVIALAFGVLASFFPYITIGGNNVVLYLGSSQTLADGTVLGATKSLWSLVSNLGTAMFVTSVGLIAGPKFFRTFNKKNFGYILMGVIIIAIGTGVSILILALDKTDNLDSSLMAGLLTGALTSTPGLSAAKEVASNADAATAGYGITYLFGVLGVVFFVQLMPKILKVDIAEERKNFVAANTIEVKPINRKLTKIDPLDVFPFALTIVFGYMIGCLKIPGINFSLGSSGGTLIAGLIIGHFGHIGPIDLRISKSTLNFFRELGLCLFLIGAGVPGGVNFISNVRVSYFIYGIILTSVPMIIGYILARFVFRMSIFNNLGSITGGMTSTPALGSLITTAGTDEVTAAYASTYPFALFCVVLAAKLLVTIM